VLAGAARAAARSWVAEHAAGVAGFGGAFFTGSVSDLPDDAETPPFSDVDVAVVVAEPERRPGPGKVPYGGVLLDVWFPTWAEVAGAAGSYHLAPSFAGDHLIADPTGRLTALRREISASFTSPDAVRRRCADVVRLVETRLSTLDPAVPWPELVPAWLFPTSLTTQAVLVAGLRRPTVRRRYLAAGEVLRAHRQDDCYLALLRLLGCADVDRPTVRRHLDRLAGVFDQAAAVARTPFPFGSDISVAARPISIDGSQQLVDAGNWREAVFWIVATFARCLQVLAADAPALLGGAIPLFRAAVAELVGLHDPAELLGRRQEVLDFLPDLRDCAARVAEAEGGL
jgi:hypothetical protein